MSYIIFSLQPKSCANTPQQNGYIKRKHHHLLNVARVFHFQANLSLYFWGECVLTATYIINLTPTHIFSGKSSYKVIFSTPSKVMFFGCLCYVHRQPSHKFDCHARKYICFGYPYGKNELKVYDL